MTETPDLRERQGIRHELAVGVLAALAPIDNLSESAFAWHMASSGEATSVRHVKLFTNGRNQAVRIPREFELPGDEALMRKEGTRLIIEPAPPRSVLALLATLQPLDETFPEIDDPVPEAVDP